jgi:translocation and assembly module TamB
VCIFRWAMASEGSRNPLAARILLLLLGIVIVLLVLGGAAAAWLLGTESGARAALGMLAARSDGTLAVDGVRGRLAGPLRADRIMIERTNERLVLTDVRLDWRPRALWQERLVHVTSLRAAYLEVVTKVDQTPEPKAGMPDSLRLPVSLRADSLRLDGGEVRRGPATLVRLGPLALSLNYADQRYRLDLQRFGATPQFDGGTATAGLSGVLELEAQRPFPLSGRFTLESQATLEERALGAAGTLVLDGSLAELRAALDLSINQAPLVGEVMLHPFSDQVLGAARIDSKALDLSVLDASLPRTALDIAFSTGADGTGQVDIHNTAPGLYEEQRLPLTHFELAFREREDGFAFDRVLARLGSSARPDRSAGQLSGTGSVVNGALQLSLRTEKIDLQRIDPRLRSTALSGRIDARHANGRQEFSVALSEPLGRQRITLAASGALADAGLEIRQAEPAAGAGRLQLSGRMALDGKQDFRAEGTLSRFRLHDFGRFEQIPEMDLNGTFALHGARAQELQAELDFEIRESRLAGHALSGSGQARVNGERLDVPRLELVSGTNRLNVQGTLADGNAKLSFSLQAPNLGQLGPAFGGAIHLEGLARGSLSQPHVTAEWRAERARLPGQLHIRSMQGKADVRVDREAPFMLRGAEATLNATGLRRNEQRAEQLDARIRFSPQPDAPLSLEIDAQGVSAAQTDFQRMIISVNGTTARHVLDATLTESKQKWTVRAAGGVDSLSADARWAGRIESFEARGRLDMRMTAPAALQVAREHIGLEGLQLSMDGGRLVLESLVSDAAGIVTRGRIEQLEMARFVHFTADEAPLKTDLNLSGAWDLRYTDTLNGSFSVRRESGDVTMQGSTPVALGLTILRADATMNAGQLALKLQANGARMGNIALAVSTRIGRDDNPLAIDREAPISGSAQVEIPSLAWLAPLITQTIAADGRLQGDVRLGGTLGRPDVSGRITGDALRVAHAELGLDLRQGTLRSNFKGDQLLLEGLAFEGPQGTIHLSGPIDLSGGVAARLLLRADRFAVLNRPDRRLVVSGESRVNWEQQRATINGAFHVDSGYFDIGQEGRPRLSDDVVIVGQEERQPGGVAATIDIAVRLGNNVVVRGRGLDAVLDGEARLVSKAGEPLQAVGVLRVAKGTFSAYGRELAIEQGVLRFTGPLDNPALDILAMRRGQEVEAGVSVRGSVLAPRVTLVSEPTVPDAEKLSWLVLGRSLALAGETEVDSLQAAATALLAQGAAAGVQSGIASAFGLDTFAVGTDQNNLEQRIVTLGKQVSTRLYLGYQHGLESAAGVVQLRYTLTPSLSIEAEAGARSALSLFYNITFD